MENRENRDKKMKKMSEKKEWKTGTEEQTGNPEKC